ncbi:MAG: hypoxanthine phosphoribosyltransferase [Desulfomonilaceae bacterium]
MRLNIKEKRLTAPVSTNVIEELIPMKAMTRRELFSEEKIAERVKEIGEQISRDYRDKPILLVGILKGVFVFMADLARNISCPCHVDFARISSYGNNMTSSGDLEIIMDVSLPVEGRDVILVDDIVDTGLTLYNYGEYLKSRNPNSLKIAALIDKTSRREKFVELDYCGFEVEDGFIVGYGLDCSEEFRNLQGLYILED